MEKVIRVKVIILILFIGFNAKSQEEFSMDAPGYYELNGDQDKFEIPFEIHNGDILIKPLINGVPTRMYVDNGVMWDQLFFFGSPILDTLNFEYLEEEVSVGGKGDGDGITNKLAENVKVDFGDLTFYKQPAIISPPELGLQNYWKDVDGQVSAMFFKHFITEIDYDKMVITLHKPEKFKLRNEYLAIAMNYMGDDSFSIPTEIKLQDGRILKRDIQLDLGGSTNFTFYYNQSDNLNPDESTELEVLGYGVQGEVRGYEKEVDYFKISNFEIDNIVGRFVEVKDQDSHQNSIVGLEVLSRFNSVFDYHNSVLYIKPNKNFNK